ASTLAGAFLFTILLLRTPPTDVKGNRKKTKNNFLLHPYWGYGIMGHGETERTAPGSTGVRYPHGPQGWRFGRPHTRGQHDGGRAQRRRAQGVTSPLDARKGQAWRRRISRATMVDVRAEGRTHGSGGVGTRPYRRDWRPGLIGEGRRKAALP